MRLNTVGLIVNPVAGLGAQANIEIAKRAIESLGAQHILTGPGQQGELAASNAVVKQPPELSGRAATQWLAREAASAEVEALVVVGGDGTFADVAFAIFNSEFRCPILGIGAGSTNVGGLLTCKANEIVELGRADYVVDSIHALIANYNDQDLALAFNDVVIGSTVLGTLEGKVIDLDATEHMAGRKIPGQPRSIAAPSASVPKILNDKTIQVAQGSLVGTVIAGFTHQDRFYGQAIVGGVCLSSLVGLPAGCLVCEQPIVRTHLDRSDLEANEPLRSAYVSLGEADAIQLTGIGPPAVLCADGNPLKCLEPEDRTQIRVQMNAVEVVRIVNRDR